MMRTETGQKNNNPKTNKMTTSRWGLSPWKLLNYQGGGVATNRGGSQIEHSIR